MTPFLQDHQLLATKDLDEAREAVAAKFCDHELGVETGRLDMEQRHLSVGRLSFNYLRYGAHTRISPGCLGSFYLLQIPLMGSAHVIHRGQEVDASLQTATLLNPDRETVMEWDSSCVKLLVQLDQDLIEEAARSLIGAALPGPVRFSPEVDMTSAGGQHLRALILSCFRAIDEKHLFMRHDIKTIKAETDLAQAILLYQPSNISHLLEKPTDATPHQLRRAVAFIHDNLQEPLTLVDIAQAAGIGVRSLQLNFQDNLGRTPMTVLRDARLDVAHYYLQSRFDPPGVSEAAYSCGYSHLGRFSRDYKLRFGLSPNQTRKKFSATHFKGNLDVN